MIYIFSELLFIKLLNTSKMFLILAWLNINFELLKIGFKQTRYVSRGTCLEGCHPQRDPLLLCLIIRIKSTCVTNGMAWRPVSHQVAAQ